MLTEIITIGDEILIGQVVDTNSAWMAQRLNAAGVMVKQISSVSDNRDHILNALAEASGRADIILITGGLGPTKDDITKSTLAEYFGAGMRRDEGALENVREIFARHNAPVIEINERQADVPDNCTVLLNKNGTAPGMWFEVGNKVYVSMPGVPFEMQYLMEEEVIPRIKKKFKLPSVIHQTILTAGLGESFLAKKIEEIENSLPEYIKLAYLPKPGQVRLRLSASGPDNDFLIQEVQRYSGRIVDALNEFVVAKEDTLLEKVVIDFMAKHSITLSTAESCTGGYVAHMLTAIPGSSEIYWGGAISYSNELKVKMLGISPDTLENFGAVSEQTVTEMAKGAINKFETDYSIAITGIAGPGGGTPEKPVGTVWIAVASKTNVRSRKFLFGNKRAQNIERSAVNALTMLLNLLREDHR